MMMTPWRKQIMRREDMLWVDIVKTSVLRVLRLGHQWPASAAGHNDSGIVRSNIQQAPPRPSSSIQHLRLPNTQYHNVWDTRFRSILSDFEYHQEVISWLLTSLESLHLLPGYPLLSMSIPPSRLLPKVASAGGKGRWRLPALTSCSAVITCNRPNESNEVNNSSKDDLAGKLLSLQPLPADPRRPGDPLCGAEEDVHGAPTLVWSTHLEIHLLEAEISLS